MEELEENKSSLLQVLADESNSKDFDKHPDSRITRLGKAKSVQLSILDYLNTVDNPSPVLKKVIADLSECGDYLVFRHYYEKDFFRLLRANFCRRHLICPLCAIRRGAKLLFKLVQKHEFLAKEYPDLEPHLLTLTIKNGHSLDERFHHLTRSTSKLVNARRNQLTRGKVISEFTKFAGGAGSYEVTFNPDTGWHPHVHFIVYLPKGGKIDIPKFINEWKKVTGDSFIVDLRKMDNSLSAMLEVTKYALKFSSLPYTNLLEAFQVLKGKNLYRSFGCLYGLTLDEDLEDDISDMELEPYIDLIYRYNETGGYRLAETRAQDPNL